MLRYLERVKELRDILSLDSNLIFFSVILPSLQTAERFAILRGARLSGYVFPRSELHVTKRQQWCHVGLVKV